MLYQVIYKNELTGKTRPEYVVSNNEINAEMRADFKLMYALRGGFIEPPFSRWECVGVKKMDDRPYRVDESQVFYV